ncbi:hypothetical protein D0469_09085 [Peribacillus saganii]|uniref:Uncharacterized protein n=1 Tax=Peribacillus saganii TaxID=2303992 RepID=A0A372LP33_9BACI|nr:hypothetical protein [Peribacillus saganii]RFU69509.1 hypothetical protein D0469_09085 [Peribacillus saganii]
MFNCLKDKKERNKKEVNVFVGMNLLVERVRFSENNDGNKKKDIVLLPAKIISTKYSKFYVIEIQSNFYHQTYHLAIFKTDFHEKVSNNILKL